MSSPINEDSAVHNSSDDASSAQPTPTPPPPTLPPPTPPAQPVSIHSMITRGKNGIVKKRLFADISTVSSSRLHMALLVHHDPKGFKTTSKHPKWVHA